ncbi:MAG TPA: NAD(P)H-hydrate dehydratase [Bacteroidota bacterium]
MERLVSAAEMKWCDETTIKGFGIPGLLLMENAGGAVARFIGTTLGTVAGKHIVVFCGKGNNGGDGFVVARHLANEGAIISVFMTSGPPELKGDALTNFTILKKLSGRTEPPIELQRYARSSVGKLKTIDGIVDAIFGTGFSGTVKQPILGLVEWINDQKAPVFAVDIPSGLNATDGTVVNAAVRATHTITFGLRKSGLLLNDGREYAGNVHVADIGIPNVVTQAKVLSKTFVANVNDVRMVLPRRPLTANKYSVGKVFVMAGSKGLTGAAALTATAALRAGAGAVLLGTPEAVYPILARKLTEAMVMPLPSTDEGTLSEKSYEVLRAKLAWADVVAIGPGLSQHPETQSVVVRILKEYSGNILLDADGLNAVAAAGTDVLKKSKATIILTPHTGEFARMTKKQSEAIDNERIEMARSLARRVRKIVVLKGAPTVTASADGTAVVNPTGNPGMATVGSGDVLSGIISALWAQGSTAESSAFGGVYLHGLAGDLAKKEYGERGMIAGDIVTFLSKAFAMVERGETT